MMSFYSIVAHPVALGAKLCSLLWWLVPVLWKLKLKATDSFHFSYWKFGTFPQANMLAFFSFSFVCWLFFFPLSFCCSLENIEICLFFFFLKNNHYAFWVYENLVNGWLFFVIDKEVYVLEAYILVPAPLGFYFLNLSPRVLAPATLASLLFPQHASHDPPQDLCI